ncbi:anti-sigma B factor antagonist [Microbacterium endophyticum]|uniref:Anti-sigma factor antagonist n=1 Tax=Microbacterium endophyticum TaxID=1526412 RepID=A0A7W4V570_9MICO|nr:STAS domain-containing protein [Microbacterium endophyticum]MBB2977068.1 anti-sigma B factor antagonist [Microbacterium endophyticum]NIK36138.1 anti-sigma B factor antagonist [Microbacterium endophyticum]
MDVTVSYEEGLIIAGIAGRFDVHSVEAFRGAVLERIDAARPNVVVDLSQVDFMDASALASLVNTLKVTMAHHGSIVLANVSESARIILELTRLDQVFDQIEATGEAQRELRLAA